jgi:hypothetical protein
MYDTLNAQVASGGVKASTLIEEALAAQPTGLHPSASATAPSTLSAVDAATTLLTLLAPEHAQLIRACATEQHRPVLDFVVGALQLVYDQGLVSQTTAQQFEDASLMERPASPPTAKACEFCGKPFTPPPDRPSARYCPPSEDNPDESCGRQASLKDLRERMRTRIPQRGVPVPPRIGPPLTAPVR